MPEKHLVDGAYISAELLVESQKRYGIELIGPARADSSPQARAKQGFAQSAFRIDFDQRSACCPADKLSKSWAQRHDRRHGRESIYIAFAKADCQSCPLRAACTSSKRGSRTLVIPTRPLYEALEEARARQQGPEFEAIYDKRAGIEGTISQATRVFGLRRSRYRGEAKTELQSILGATALNIVRIVDWLHDVPRARTRQARFVSLAKTG